MTYRTRCHWWHLSESRWRSCSLSADGSRACRKIDSTRVTLSSLPLFRGETRRLPNSLCHPGHVAQPVTKELRQFDQSARTCLSQAEFPRDLGNSLITTISRVARQTKAMTPEQLERYVLLENAKLDRLDEKLRSATVMIHALGQKTPWLKNLLKSKGIGDSALIVAQIIAQSEGWH